jgi:hypothetical protein
MPSLPNANRIGPPAKPIEILNTAAGKGETTARCVCTDCGTEYGTEIGTVDLAKMQRFQRRAATAPAAPNPKQTATPSTANGPPNSIRIAPTGAAAADAARPGIAIIPDTAP